MKFKTIKMLKEQYGITNWRAAVQIGGIVQINGFIKIKGFDAYITDSMVKFFDGKDYIVQIVKRDSNALTIKVPDITHDLTWIVYDEWIDNRPEICYNELNKLFKEEL